MKKKQPTVVGALLFGLVTLGFSLPTLVHRMMELLA
jgi:hypothetical protein